MSDLNSLPVAFRAAGGTVYLTTVDREELETWRPVHETDSELDARAVADALNGNLIGRVTTAIVESQDGLLARLTAQMEGMD